MYQIAAMLDIFKGQLTLDDIMTIELPLLTDLYNARAKFLEDKKRIEDKELARARAESRSSSRTRKG